GCASLFAPPEWEGCRAPPPGALGERRSPDAGRNGCGYTARPHPITRRTSMPLDPKAVGLTGTPTERSWNFKDAILYALGVGCGVDELQFTTEKNQQVLPTFAVIVGMGGIPFDQ